MTMLEHLLDAFRNAASRQYGGEPVTEYAHSLQCAELAADEGADEELVLACLLHDVGRFAVDQRHVFDSKEIGPAGPRRSGRGHHEVGAALIAPYVPERLAWLVRMHADAKRYLCAAEEGYFDSLTAASKHTLTLQGGIMSPAEMAAVEPHPWLPAALALRRWDDRAKDPHKPPPALGRWEPLLQKYFG